MKLALHIGTGAINGHTKIILELAGAFVRRGHQVDVLGRDLDPRWQDKLPTACRFVPVARGNRHGGLIQALAADPAFFLPLAGVRPHGAFAHVRSMAAYLAEASPDAVLVSQDMAPEAVFARRITNADAGVVVRVNTSLDRYYLGDPGYARKNARMFTTALRAADEIVFLTDGERRTSASLLGGKQGRTIPNPLPRELAEMDLDAVEHPHPWLADDGPPVLVAAGRLVEQKGFETLLRAVGLILDSRPVRAIILGEGSQRSDLEALARSLGIAEAVLFAGFAPQPARYFRHADLGVLSSFWEGFPNVLLEALWAGCPVVSTDCPFGPAEILDGGTYGRLVPAGEPPALAAAILAMLDQPFPDVAARRAHAASFVADRIADRYLDLMLELRASPERRSRSDNSSPAISATGNQNKIHPTDRF